MIHRLSTAVAPGLPRHAFEALVRGRLLVFNYHEISDHPSRFSLDFHLNVTPATFAQQLQWITSHFNVIGPRQLLANDFELPAALVTFDDGFLSAFTVARPILEAAGLPATVFMNMAVVHGALPWAGLVTYLCGHHRPFQEFIRARRGGTLTKDTFLFCSTRDVAEFCERQGTGVLDEAEEYAGEYARPQDLAAAVGSGLHLGNHLFNHYNAEMLDAAELREQYDRNEAALAGYDNHVNLFSYPFGQPDRTYSRRTDDLLQSWGAARLLTAVALPNRRDARRLHRTTMFESVNTEARFRANCVVPAAVNQLAKAWRYTHV